MDIVNEETTLGQSIDDMDIPSIDTNDTNDTNDMKK